MNGILEPDGKTSSVRITMFLCTFAAIGLAFLGMWKGLELTGVAVLCGMFLGAGIGGKVAQKGKENIKEPK